MPKISIVVPNYNHAAFLNQRLECIFKQTYQDFEVILMDDCSTDKSLEILALYSNHPKVSHFIINNKNSGSPFYQWKKGIELAAGEYIWIAESDDWCELSLLEELISGALKDDKIVISYCQSHMIQTDQSIRYTSTHRALSEILDGKEFSSQNMLLGNKIFNSSMAIFKRAAFSTIPDEYLKYKFCGDWVFWVSILSQGKVHISGKVLNYFRNHLDNTSTSYYSSGFNFIEELNLLLYFKSLQYFKKSIIMDALTIKFLNLLKHSKSIPKQNYSEVLLHFTNTVPKRLQLKAYYLYFNYQIRTKLSSIYHKII